MKPTYRVVRIIFVVFFLLASSIQATDWASITESELHDLPPSDFERLTAAELSTIPVTACRGFKSDQINAIPVEAVEGFKADQISQLTLACSGFSSDQVKSLSAEAASGVNIECISYIAQGSSCSGLTKDFMAALNPTAFSGFTAQCISAVPGSSLMNINRTQLALILPSSCEGFLQSQIPFIPTSTLAGLTSDCLRHFSSNYSGGCLNIDGRFAKALSDESFKGFTASCIRVARTSIFSQISMAQLMNIPPIAFEGFRYHIVLNIPAEVLVVATIDQLVHLPNDAIQGLTPTQLTFIVNKYKLDIVNRWTAAQTQSYFFLSAIQFKQNVPQVVPYMTSWSEVSKNLESVSWLQILLLDPSPAPVFDKHTLSRLNPTAFVGLRADHVALIAPENFGYFSPNATVNLLNDTVRAFTPEQFMNFPAESVNYLVSYAINGLKPAVISVMSPAQITQLDPAQLFALSCKQLGAFNYEQLAQFPAKLLRTYNSAITNCPTISPFSAPPIVATPVSTPISVPVVQPHTVPVASQPMAAPLVVPTIVPVINPPTVAPFAGVRTEGLTTTEFVVIISVNVIGLTVLGGIITFFAIRKRHQCDAERRRLLDDEHSVAEDRYDRSPINNF